MSVGTIGGISVGKSYFHGEMGLLKKFTPPPRRDELSTAATLEVNESKNRYRFAQLNIQLA